MFHSFAPSVRSLKHSARSTLFRGPGAAKKQPNKK